MPPNLQVPFCHELRKPAQVPAYNEPLWDKVWFRMGYITEAWQIFSQCILAYNISAGWAG